MIVDAAAIAERLARVRARIDAAALAAGRDPSSVRLVAVTKRLPPEAALAAYEAGQRDFGENYVQEGVAKAEALAARMPGARWHLLGRLQSNKAAAAVRTFSLLHGIDSASTTAAVAKAATAAGAMAATAAGAMAATAAGAMPATAGGAMPATAGGGTPAAAQVRPAEVLLQVKLGGGDARGGVDEAAAEDFLREASRHRGIRFAGLMGVADPASSARPQFARLAALAARLAALGLECAPLGELSMGMTGDFEDAIAEGATLVRIGTAIFGERPVPA